MWVGEQIEVQLAHPGSGLHEQRPQVELGEERLEALVGIHPPPAERRPSPQDGFGPVVAHHQRAVTDQLDNP